MRFDKNYLYLILSMMVIGAIPTVLTHCHNSGPTEEQVKQIEKKSAEPYKNCKHYDDVETCDEQYPDTAAWIETFDVPVTKESLDPKYKFAKPRDVLCCTYLGFSDGVKHEIPGSARMILKDGKVFWHWSEVTAK